ncbi:MAG TPA: hypothetical protein VFR68_15760 [Candidatus Dormibacteraeota bacterium]|nr:hypothetical protein [Candidatus Dormibacteraeota bacterium]
MRSNARQLELAAEAGEAPRGGRRVVLDYGLAYERMSVEFWSKLAAATA